MQFGAPSVRCFLPPSIVSRRPTVRPSQMLLTEEDAHEAFGQRMLGRIQSQSSATWMQTLIDDAVSGTTYQSTQAAMDDPDLGNHHVGLGDDGFRLDHKAE